MIILAENSIPMKTTSQLLHFTPIELANEALTEVPLLTTKISKACEIPQGEVIELLKEVICFLILIGKSNKILTPL
jgi:hypothetical protein